MNNEIYLTGDVVDNDLGPIYEEFDIPSIYPMKVYNFLNSVEGDIVVRLNTYGGSVFSALDIYNLFKDYKGGKVSIHISGVAASAGSVIAMSGTELIFPKASYLMIHQPSSNCYGTSSDFRKEAEVLDNIKETILDIYMSKANPDIDRDTMNTMILEETWISGTDVANYFNVTEVTEDDAIEYPEESQALATYNKIPDKIMNHGVEEIRSIFNKIEEDLKCLKV